MNECLEDLQEIKSVSSKIMIEGDRYPEDLKQATGR
jgi:hypothetical protein